MLAIDTPWPKITPPLDIARRAGVAGAARGSHIRRRFASGRHSPPKTVVD